MTAFDDIHTSQILDRADVLFNIDDPHGYQKSYNMSYQYFVEYFADGRVLTTEDLVIGANFCYGWMPTILTFKTSEFGLAVKALNKARSSRPLPNAELILLKELINNSLVGVSKLLHFINPNVYAIWDSRVCNFLLGKDNQNILVSPEVFKSYLLLCNRVVCEPDFHRIHSLFSDQVGYEVSELRVVEQIMFHSSGKPLKVVSLPS